jgi:Amt family ammonium transporter
MLPDIDGWDLLTRLSEMPDTRDIPVIVCSVVSDPELAIALGAMGCLTKPVQRPEFLAALNRVANRS